jgi:hypothetical protein
MKKNSCETRRGLMSDDIEYPRFEQYVWVGPQLISDNGLELRSIVTEDRN